MTAEITRRNVLTSSDVTELMERARTLVAEGNRAFLGITGLPGSGKSTFAAGLVELLNARPTPDGPEWVALVPMDGFHLTRAQVQRQGLEARRGAPETLDVGGYLALLRRLAADLPETVYAPEFDREVGDAVNGAIRIPPQARLIVTEGNYLLLDDPAWLPLRTVLDEVWFCDVDEDRRMRQLVDRHVRYGMSPAEAWAWAAGPDRANADLVRASRDLVDVAVAGAATGARHARRP